MELIQDYRLGRADLPDAGVRFIADPHGYERKADGKPLEGVTKMIEMLLFAGEYAAVDPDVLAAKAAWGTARHHEIQDMIVFDEEPTTQAQRDFAAIMAEKGLVPVASEYTVTDGEHFASNIDVVCEDGALVDIKTVASLNRSKVSWQLSLYARFFEMTTGLKAGRLFAAWLPKSGEPRMVEVPRKPDEQLDALIDAWIHNHPYEYDSKIDHALVAEVSELKYTIARLQESLEKAQGALLEQMQEVGETKYSDGLVTISVRGASTTKRFDSKAFKEADPDTYAKYMVESSTAPTLAVKLVG